MKDFAIVGFGCAGYYAAKAIRHALPEVKIDIYSEHSEAPYNPMLTTYYASGKLPREGMFPFGNLERIQRELCANIYSDTKVQRIDAKAKKVITEKGEKRVYDALLVATGASAFIPPIKGNDSENVYYMRTLEDADRMKERMKQNPPRKAVVVGASMVGIKVAELLCNAGAKTILADMAEYMFPLAAYRDFGELIGNRIKERGIELLFGCGLTEIKHTEAGLEICFSDGSEKQADMIVCCIGTRANTAFVDGVEKGKGIKVGENMQTSAEGVFAAGDCCEGKNLQSRETGIIGLWANAANQGITAGCNMAGTGKQYNGNILHNITHFMGMDFIGLGNCMETGETIYEGNPENGLYVKAVLKGGRLAGVNILDNYRISGIIRHYFMRLLEGRTDELTTLQRGILVKEGLSENFIDELEGKLK